MARCRWLATALPALWSLALALPLPVAEDPRLYLSVKDFGAKGDGAALDARAIQRAIDAAQLRGRALFVPAGVYLINETLRVRPNFRTSGGDNYGQPGDGAHNSSVRILGEGMELSVLQAHPPSPSAPLHSILAFDKAENSEMQEVSQLFLKAGREPSNATGTPVSGQLGLAMVSTTLRSAAETLLGSGPKLSVGHSTASSRRASAARASAASMSTARARWQL